MARFFGEVGYGEDINIGNGVHELQITSRNYYGDVIRNTRSLDDGQKINNDLTVGNSISVVADAYALNHFLAIRFVVWAGIHWDVSNVEVQGPRLILRLGGVYNGPKE